MDEIRKLPSVQILEVYVEAGDQLSLTVDMRSDCGYVVLVNENAEQLYKDLEYILERQQTLFTVEGLLNEMSIESYVNNSFPM